MPEQVRCVGGRKCRCPGWVACPMEGEAPCTLISPRRDDRPMDGHVSMISPTVVAQASYRIASKVSLADRLRWPGAVFPGDDPKADALKAAKRLKKERRNANRVAKRACGIAMWNLRAKDPENQQTQAWFQRQTDQQERSRIQSVHNRKAGGTYGTTKGERHRTRVEENYERLQHNLYPSDSDDM